MTDRTSRWHAIRFATAFVTLAALAGCGSSNGARSTPTPTVPGTNVPAPTGTRTSNPGATVSATAQPRTPTPGSSASVQGFLVVNRAVNAGTGDGLGAPPAEWMGNGDPSSFDRSLAHADWSVDGGADKQGVTGTDGHFEITGLSPGRHTLNVSKTLAGNLASFAVPFSVGDDGSADVLIEVSWGLVKSTSTYANAGAEVRDIRGPYGTWLVTRAGQVTEFGDAARIFGDPDGDGRFDVSPCTPGGPPPPGPCPFALVKCQPGETCACPPQCPNCQICGPDSCSSPTPTPAPAACDGNGMCAQPGDRCVCIPSCPECDDCVRMACVPGCPPVEISAITVTSGPTELVVGQQGAVYATAQLSDGSQIDVTYLATWASSDAGVASVDSWGNVSALAIGGADLTATIGTLSSAPWSLHVVARPTLLHIDVQNASCLYPLGIPVDYGSGPPVIVPPAQGSFLPRPSCGQVVQVGATLQFRALGEFANGYYQDITDEVSWQVAPTAVGDVAGGVFTARQAGTGQLTAALGAVVSDDTAIQVVTQPTLIGLSIFAENGVVAYADGTPPPGGAALPCVALDPAQTPGSATFPGPGCCCPGPAAGAVLPCECNFATTVLRGDHLQFRATAYYDTGQWRDVTDEATWRSSNPAAATIDAHGAMTAVEGGDAAIDAVLTEITSNVIDVHVVDHATLQSLYIYQEGGDHVVAKGDQRFFKAMGSYDVGFTRDVTDTATWRSDNETVGGFDSPGVFTGRSAGTAFVWAQLDGLESSRQSLEVFETSEITYCDPAHVNRAIWSDDFDRVTLESDCSDYRQPGLVTLRYSVTETQPHGGIFNPCLDLYVVQGQTRVRAIREEGCGDPFLPAAAPGRDEAVLKYQLRAFWDLKDEAGNPVPPGTYTIYGRFYLYYDPVVTLDVTVLSPDGSLPSPTPTPAGPQKICLREANRGQLCTSDADCPGSRCVATTLRCSYGTYDGSLCVNDGDCPGGCCGGCHFPPTPGIILAVGTASAFPGENATFTVDLKGVAAGGVRANNAQLDIIFDTTFFAVPTSASETCTIDPRLASLTHTESFPDSPPVPAGMMRLRLSVVDTSPPLGDLTDGTLYRCTLRVTAAALGSSILEATRQNVGDTMGTSLASATANGIVFVRGGGRSPTPTPFVFCTPPPCKPGEVYSCPGECPGGCGTICVPFISTPSPTPAAGPTVVVSVRSVVGHPGEQVNLQVALERSATSAGLARVQTELVLDAHTAVAVNAAGGPDCVVEADAVASGSFTFLPAGCHAGVDCHGVSALLETTDQSGPLLAITVLYTCTIGISDDAAVGVYPVGLTVSVASDTQGNPLDASAVRGNILVKSIFDDTPTPTAAATAVLTSTPTPALPVEGACFRGFAAEPCTGDPFLTSQAQCCELSRLSDSLLPFFWCSSDQFDANRTCNACRGPCDGLLPPTPTTTAIP